MRKLVHEPLVHFAILALALLLLDGLIGGRETDSGRQVEPARVVQQLREDFLAARGRAMTPAEEAAALEKYRHEEDLFRSGLALGIHETDPVVRRRIVQRMRSLTEDTFPIREPTVAELETIIRANPAKFPPIRKVSFEHRFFARAVHGEDVSSAAMTARRKLNSGAVVAGDTFPKALPTHKVGKPQLARVLGPAAAAAVYAVTETTWSLPIESAYGAHLVRILASESRPVGLEDANVEARAMWLQEQRRRVGRELSAQMRRELEGG